MCVSSVFASRVLVFVVTLFLVIILDQKCGSSVASAASWASLRGGEPCCILTQDTFLSRDEFVCVMPQQPRRVDKKQKTV